MAPRSEALASLGNQGPTPSLLNQTLWGWDPQSEFSFFPVMLRRLEFVRMRAVMESDCGLTVGRLGRDGLFRKVTSKLS